MYMLLNVQVLNGGNLCGWNCGTRALSNCYEDRIKDALGQNYAAHFSKTPFALKGGLPGTTARLTAWWLDKKPRHGAQHRSLTDPCFLPSLRWSWGLEHWPRWWTKEKHHRHWWHCCCNSWKHLNLQILSQKRKPKWQQFTWRFQLGNDWRWLDSLLVLWESLIYESGIPKKSVEICLHHAERCRIPCETSLRLKKMAVKVSLKSLVNY